MAERYADLTPSASARRPAAARELRLLGLDRLARGARVLEVGTGTGRLALGYAPSARTVLAIDPDAASIAQAERIAQERGLANIRFAAIAAEDLDVGRERFDLAVLAWAL